MKHTTDLLKTIDSIITRVRRNGALDDALRLYTARHYVVYGDQAWTYLAALAYGLHRLYKIETPVTQLKAWYCDWFGCPPPTRAEPQFLKQSVRVIEAAAREYGGYV